MQPVQGSGFVARGHKPGHCTHSGRGTYRCTSVPRSRPPGISPPCASPCRVVNGQPDHQPPSWPSRNIAPGIPAQTVAATRSRTPSKTVIIAPSNWLITLIIGGVGAFPGAAIGAAAGAQAGAWVLGLLGLASLVEGLGTALGQALSCYASGIENAWGPTEWHPHRYPARAPHEFARGHEILVMALLAAMAAYLSRGRGDKQKLLQEIRQSRAWARRWRIGWPRTKAGWRHTRRSSRPSTCSSWPPRQSATPGRP